jgi:uncharacterized protein YndB with AHSA1/START domain
MAFELGQLGIGMKIVEPGGMRTDFFTRSLDVGRHPAYELRPGGAYRAHASPEMQAMGVSDVVIDGVVEEADPPRKLVHTYRFLFSEAMKAEGFTRVTWEIEKVAAGFSRLTVIHELEGAPIMAGMVASKFSEQGTGGWAWILSDMKSLLETGSSM